MIDYYPVMNMKHRLQGIAYLLCGTIIWGTAFVAQSAGMERIGPFTFQAVRSSLAVIGLLAAIALFDRKKHKSFLAEWRNPRLWKIGLPCGLALFLAASMQQIGLLYTDAGKAGFITALYIVLVPILGLFHGKKPAISTVFSVAVAVAGLYLLSCAGVSGINIGDIFLVGGALGFAIQITLVGQYATGLDSLRLNCIQCLICSVISWLIIPFREQFSIQDVLASWLPLCYAGILSMSIAYTLQIAGQQRLEATAASLIMSLESVVAVIAGGLILGERMTPWEMAGCVLVFCAVVLSQLPRKQKTPA